MSSNLPGLWVLGCVQNGGSHLPNIFANLEKSRDFFSETNIFILENDSSDNTRLFLSQYRKQRVSLQAKAFQGLNERIPEKTVRLAALRNAGLDWIQSQGAYDRPNDLVMILDLDEVNADPWDLSQFEQVLFWFLARHQAGGVFANQKGPYYDLWAFRHPVLCPHDIWWHVYQMHLRHPQWSDDECLHSGYLPWQVRFDPEDSPFVVESAFGGLGLYKASWLRKAQAPYCGEQARWLALDDGGVKLLRWQIAEHVSFHAGLRAAGASLWIYPGWINWNTQVLADRGGLRPNPSSWRFLSF